MSKFHHYSLNNTILIWLQKPDSTRVCGLKTWNQMGRHVKKGEKGITIIAPAPFKKKVQVKRIDPATGQPVMSADGQPVTTEQEIQVPSYRTVKIFDLSQTEGEPLPEISTPLTGDVEHYEAFMEALRRSSPVPVKIGPVEGGADGFFSLSDQSITIREGMSQVQTVYTLIHELTHARCHNSAAPIPEDAEEYEEVEAFGVPGLFANERISAEEIPDGLFRYDLRGSDDDSGQPAAVEHHVRVNHAGTLITVKPLIIPDGGFLPLTEEEGLNFTGESLSIPAFQRAHPKDRRSVETEAEAVAYTCASYFSIEKGGTGDNSFAYIASWSKDKTLPELRASLETIVRTSDHLITDIERNFADVCKERGIPCPESWERTVNQAREAAAEVSAERRETRNTVSKRRGSGKTGKRRTSKER